MFQCHSWPVGVYFIFQSYYLIIFYSISSLFFFLLTNFCLACIAMLLSSLPLVSMFFHLVFITIVIILNYIGLFVTGQLASKHVRMVFRNETSNEVINRKRYSFFFIHIYLFICFLFILVLFIKIFKGIRIFGNHLTRTAAAKKCINFYF